MVSWQQVLDDAPEFAATVQARFEIRKHATMATLRKDGSPRISGTEVEFEAGQLRLGSMPGALKAVTCAATRGSRCTRRRMTRRRRHRATGAAKRRSPGSLSSSPDPDNDDDAHSFQVDVSEVVFTRVAPSGEHLVIQMWHPGRGLEEVQRR